jgi:hypothetical protein
MELKHESLCIFFFFILVIFTIRILFKGTTSKEIIMLTFDNVKSRSLVSNQSLEVIMSEILFGASVKQSQLEVHTTKPGFEVIIVLLSINQKSVWLYH